jgi:hypothetical protein
VWPLDDLAVCGVDLHAKVLPEERSEQKECIQLKDNSIIIQLATGSISHVECE